MTFVPTVANAKVVCSLDSKSIKVAKDFERKLNKIESIRATFYFLNGEEMQISLDNPKVSDIGINSEDDVNFSTYFTLQIPIAEESAKLVGGLFESILVTNVRVSLRLPNEELNAIYHDCF